MINVTLYFNDQDYTFNFDATGIHETEGYLTVDLDDGTLQSFPHRRITRVIIEPIKTENND